MPFNVPPSTPADQPVYDAVEKWLRRLAPDAAPLPATIDVDNPLFKGSAGSYGIDRRKIRSNVRRLNELLVEHQGGTRPGWPVTYLEIRGAATARHVIAACL